MENYIKNKIIEIYSDIYKERMTKNSNIKNSEITR